ncbi:hypothetical protein ACIRNY_11375 [Capnocytophaga canimorsus]|uniref:hypothetical protein n=1 Tax=Capnocytophaga canimorsus TaxID=28188 RepID=UPI00249B053E|nr:hypothetical protein [Capnocytophaga canimorsus]WGU68532.1 hypothetical protein QIU19_00420 [Capnocytophaga canimorsus]WGU70360.1 hypothetical protein QIU18_13125 [Capnocytophaga canimorsus]
MTSTLITNKINIEIASGSVAFSQFVTLEKGTCIGAYLVPIKTTSPDHLIEISVKDPQSNSLIEPVDFRDFEHKGGGYLQGMKQVNFPTNDNKFSINVLSDVALGSDFKAQLIFVIDRNEGCGCQKQ